MARKNQPGCPCCNQQKCGCQCQNWRPHLGGTVTDLNGVQTLGTSLACGLSTGPGSVFGSTFGPLAGIAFDGACHVTGCYFNDVDRGFVYYYQLICNGSSPPQLWLTIKGARQGTCGTNVGIEFANSCWGTADMVVARVTANNPLDPFHSTYTFPAVSGGIRNHIGTVTVDVPTDPAVPVTCCSPCPLPHKNLTVSWNFPVVPPGWAATGSMALNFDNSQPVYKWASPCFVIDDGTGPSGYQWKMACNAGTAAAYLFRYPGSTMCAGTGLGSLMTGPLSYTCLPLHMVFNPFFLGGFGSRVFIDE